MCLTTCAVCTSKTTQTLVNWRLRLPTRLQRAVLNKPRSFLYLRTLERKVILLLLALQHRNVNYRLVASVFGKKDSSQILWNQSKSIYPAVYQDKLSWDVNLAFSLTLSSLPSPPPGEWSRRSRPWQNMHKLKLNKVNTQYVYCLEQKEMTVVNRCFCILLINFFLWAKKNPSCLGWN